MILTNKARCKKCGDTIESKHRHERVSCSCGAIFVDGGHVYIRRGGEPKNIEELSTSTMPGGIMKPTRMEGEK